MNLHNYCFDFQKKNLKWPIVNIIFIFVYFPLEMIIFSVLFGKMFSMINNIEKNYNSICLIIGLIIAGYIFLELLSLYKERLENTYYQKLDHHIRMQIIDIIFNKMKINYESINSGEYIGRLLKIPKYVNFFYERLYRWVAPLLITIITVILYLFYLNFKIGLIALISFSIYFGSYYLQIKSEIKSAKEKEIEENKVMSETNDSLDNYFSVITCDRIEYERRRINKTHELYNEKYENQYNINDSFKTAINFINIIIFAIIVFFTLKFYKEKELNYSTAISIIILIVFVVKQFKNLAPRSCETIRYYAHVKENSNFITSIINDTTLDGKIDNINILGNIEFKNVTFSYPESTQLALDNVSFTVKPKEHVAIIGKSASGKTSIIKLLLGFYQPLKGEILIDGVNIKDLSKSFLRNNISIVHQNVKLFNRSVIHNIAFGTKYKVAEIKEKLKTLKVMEVFDTLPNGLDTIAGKYGDNLSGGQKQIVYMLRCYFRENPIILLDEPTSAVDQYNKKYVLEMIEELSKNATCLIVSHDPSIYNSDKFPKKFGIEMGILKPLK